MSCDKQPCPKHGQDNQISGTLKTTPPAMPFWSELSLILSLGNLARTLLHEDCSLLGGHTRCDSGYLTPPKFRRVLRRKMLRDTWVCRKCSILCPILQQHCTTIPGSSQGIGTTAAFVMGFPPGPKASGQSNSPGSTWPPCLGSQPTMTSPRPDAGS